MGPIRLLPRESSRVPWAFGLLAVVVQALVSLVGGPEEVPWLYEDLGLTGGALRRGWIWTLVTYALLHGSWSHVLLNAWFLGWFGSRVAWILGTSAFWRVLAAGVLGGALVHLGLGPPGTLVGVSGGISALVLWVCTVSPESRMWPVPLSARSFGLGLLLASGCLAVLSLLAGPAGWGDAGLFRVSHACHFGGGLAGWALARWTLRPRAGRSELRTRRQKGEGRREGGLR